MSEGHSTYTPKTGIERWFDARMPLPRLIYDSFVAYPVPRNLNYMWTFGGILSIMLVSQILTGIVLAMHKKLNSLKNSRLVLCSVGPKLMELIKLTRLDRLLTIKPTQREAALVFQ